MRSKSVWMRAASPRQYSAEELVNMILGRLPSASSRASNAPACPVTGSVCGVSVNGKRSGMT